MRHDGDGIFDFQSLSVFLEKTKQDEQDKSEVAKRGKHEMGSQQIISFMHTFA